MVQYRLTWTLKPLTVMIIQTPLLTIVVPKNSYLECKSCHAFMTRCTFIDNVTGRDRFEGHAHLPEPSLYTNKLGTSPAPYPGNSSSPLNLVKCFRGQVLTSKLCRTTQPEKHEVGVYIDRYLGSSWTGRAPLSFGWWKGWIIVPYYSHWLNIYQCSRTRTSCAC